MNRFLAASLVLSIAACGSNTDSHGTVPADLRDVERAGEGLVSATFGSFPDRKPDWMRAAQVNAILKAVWSRTKAGTPSLPANRITEMDAAIAKLDAAIVAMNQKDAAFAANSVGLTVPDLFQHFNPDAPEEIVRLDAVFRQVGLDAHFGDWTAAAADLKSMKTDWNNSKSPVGQRVPMCHRVGGTATVMGDIDASLANLDTAIAHMDRVLAETESENGALEIDTLELLFDCPPDNQTPASGLGAKCTKDSQCDAGQTCDLMNAGGKCAPSAASAAIGTRCTSTTDCGTDGRAACQTEAGDGYPGGYCFMEPCDDVQVCPAGATCVALGGERPGCFKSCAVDADCQRTPASDKEHYVCQLFSVVAPTGFGPSDHACAFACTRDGDCNAPMTCDIATGKCKP